MKIPHGTLLLALVVFIDFGDGSDERARQRRRLNIDIPGEPATQEHQHPAPDLDSNTIEIQMKNGFCYHGEIKYPGGNFIPSWMHRYQKQERTDNFAAFILLDDSLHSVATIYWNQEVVRKAPTDKIIARIRIAHNVYYLAESFEKYDVKTHYHIPGLEWRSPYYPQSNCVYIKVPVGGKNVVYKSQLKFTDYQPLQKFV